MFKNRKKTPTPPVGSLVFFPKLSACHSAFYVVARIVKDERSTRVVGHRIDCGTGLPKVCPDPRCASKGLACCAITTASDTVENTQPLTRDEITVMSTEQPRVIAKVLAEQPLAALGDSR